MELSIDLSDILTIRTDEAVKLADRNSTSILGDCPVPRS